MLRHVKALQSLALMGALALLGPADAWAQATDLVCDQCVGTSDLAVGAVKGGRIAGGAVTSGKIADGEVKTPDLAVDAVTSPRIQDGQVKTPDLANGAVTTGKLAVGAVRGGRIANGAVGASKLAPDAVFGRIFVVRNDPLDQVGNCDELLAVLADITDNDADNRYTIWLEPGIYDCGTQRLFMKPFVNIRGSGQGLTQIVGSPTSEIVRGANDVELSMLRVEHIGSDFPAAISTAGTSMRISHVTAIGRNAGTNAFGIVAGGTASLVHVTAIADTAGSTATGVLIGSGAPTLVNVTAIGTNGAAASRGVSINGSNAVTARNSVFAGSTDALAAGLGGTANIMSTQLDGGVSAGLAVYRCVGAYDGNFAPLDNACNPIP